MDNNSERPLLEKLKSIKEKIDRLRHVNKSDVEYYNATSLTNELLYLLPNSKNIRLSAKILDKYSLTGSDSKKEHFLNEFKVEMSRDIRTIIQNMERIT